MAKKVVKKAKKVIVEDVTSSGVTVTSVPSDSSRITKLEARVDLLVDRISKAKSVKGI